jgi:hypothetical protein
MSMPGARETCSSPSSQQEVESRRQPSSVPQVEVPPTPPRGTLAARGDPDEDDDGGSLSHSTKSSEELEPKGWVA